MKIQGRRRALPLENTRTVIIINFFDKFSLLKFNHDTIPDCKLETHSNPKYDLAIFHPLSQFFSTAIFRSPPPLRFLVPKIAKKTFKKNSFSSKK